MNCELPDVQAGFIKGRGTRDQIANICWIIEKARKFQKNIYFCFIDYTKAVDCVESNKLWKILQEMGIPDHLTCVLRNLYSGQEATIRIRHGTTDWFLMGKEYVKAVYCHPAYLTYMQSTSCEMLGWMKHKLKTRLPGEISITSDMQVTPLYSRKWRGTKKFLVESEREEWKSWLKVQHLENEDHGIWSHHFMGNRWGNSGNSVWLYFGGAPKSLQMVIAVMKLKDACSLEGKLWPT